jgi:hypothetical protein
LHAILIVLLIFNAALLKNVPVLQFGVGAGVKSSETSREDVVIVKNNETS